MSFNISSLPNYVDQNSRKFLVESIYEADTAKLLKDAGTIMVGIKGTTAIQQLHNDIVLQDASASCERNPQGATTFSQSFITVKPLKDETNFCQKPLENKWMSQFLSKGQEYTQLLFANDIMTDRANKIAEANEFLIWQGNVSITGTTNLNQFNGYLIQMSGSTATTPTGATLVEKIQNLYLSVPAKVRTQSDFRIVIGADVYAEYIVALSNKNIFRPVDDVSVYGTPAKFAVVNGLVGTRKVVATRLRSLVLGTDLLGEEDKASMNYSIETKNIYVDFYYALGVAAIYQSEITLGTV
ncbi:hypothetical protein BDD43_2842 [Mucilaginibacter gracilis]|uniref:Uncharacterized protein n=1 Tax=Mucilaginibacter gracilis TaxID=423350 RepID=A0A495J136_9SPHI|nr:hypothetical protein [Mucilaginibacter gracilis]RKR82657.1 hypothetical protein BDD43_2842 [Mucilaginibacter gracilis]